FDQAPMEDRVARAFQTLLDDLRGMGHAVSEVEMPDVVPVPELIHAISEEINRVHAEFRERGLVYGADVARRLDDCAAVTPGQSQAGLEWQRMIRARFAAALQGVDLLITPTSPVTRKEIGNDSIGDRHYRAVLSWFTAIVNHALHPAIALPLTGSGEPAVSLQAIGSLGSETRLIAFGRSLESAGVVGFSPAPLGVGSA
ncbi:MAG TPA: amidase family protein, partial [Acidimicrobiia bacterium]|nr:amidase family protein [Acidimicrobiia bacterium]